MGGVILLSGSCMALYLNQRVFALKMSGLVTEKRADITREMRPS